jgi:hypothetical protein
MMLINNHASFSSAYDPEHPPPNLGIDFFGSLRRLVSQKEKIVDFRHSFQVRLDCCVVKQTMRASTQKSTTNR